MFTDRDRGIGGLTYRDVKLRDFASKAFRVLPHHFSDCPSAFRSSTCFRNRLGNINAKIAAQRVEETSPQKWKEARSCFGGLKVQGSCCRVWHWKCLPACLFMPSTARH